MSDKEKAIAALMAAAIRAGYKITFEGNDIGVAKPNGMHIDLAYVDELYPELSNFNVFDYINKELVKGEQ